MTHAQFHTDMHMALSSCHLLFPSAECVMESQDYLPSSLLWLGGRGRRVTLDMQMTRR